MALKLLSQVTTYQIYAFFIDFNMVQENCWNTRRSPWFCALGTSLPPSCNCGYDWIFRDATVKLVQALADEISPNSLCCSSVSQHQMFNEIRSAL